MKNARRGLAVAGIAIAVLSVVGIWQSDRAISDEKRILSDETLSITLTYCDVTGSQLPDCQAARDQIANARSQIALLTVAFWLSIVFVIVGLAVLVIGLTGPEIRDRPKTTQDETR